ncbi:19677_t:CDS:2, partial [Dentiscutata erythropus]
MLHRDGSFDSDTRVLNSTDQRSSFGSSLSDEILTVNDDLQPTTPPFAASFQKYESSDSDTRVLNSSDQSSSFASSLSDEIFQVNDDLPPTIPPLATSFQKHESFGSDTRVLNSSDQSSSFVSSFSDEIHPTTPLSINTHIAQEHSPQSGFFNTQGQSYKPPSHSSSQENLYRPDDRSSLTQVTSEGDSNEGVEFKSPLFRNKTLSPLAGTATTIPSDYRPLSLRTAARMSQLVGETSSAVQSGRFSSGNEM